MGYKCLLLSGWLLYPLRLGVIAMIVSVSSSKQQNCFKKIFVSFLQLSSSNYDRVVLYQSFCVDSHFKHRIYPLSTLAHKYNYTKKMFFFGAWWKPNLGKSYLHFSFYNMAYVLCFEVTNKVQ